MKALQIISSISFILLTLLKFNVFMINVDNNIVHYLFNASVMLMIFSVIFPLVSYAKLKNANVEEERVLNQILKKIDPTSTTRIFVSTKTLKNNAAALYRKNNMVIVVGEKLLHTLDEKQLTFLIAHEYFHIKKNHLMKNVFSFIFVLSGVPIALLITTPIIGAAVPIVPLLIFAVVIYISFFILHFVFSRRREFQADQFARSFVEPTDARETLTKLKENKLVDEKSFSLLATHPSIEKRISNVN
ncbi:M48 family metalloprotease [Guptibacillus algicola]|uniref:M48 family metalloprotease n=1 Tax=Guptibacillus algicola TaxID=225844 RepID=UPI001CD269DE|nr:M48 family metalloprotease [Alkalihalobacillus algicola]MCA0987321.1 M48 family metallopeptidase [Alkalihalobacillus algicola]